MLKPWFDSPRFSGQRFRFIVCFAVWCAANVCTVPAFVQPHAVTVESGQASQATFFWIIVFPKILREAVLQPMAVCSGTLCGAGSCITCA